MDIPIFSVGSALGPARARTCLQARLWTVSRSICTQALSSAVTATANPSTFPIQNVIFQI